MKNFLFPSFILVMLGCGQSVSTITDNSLSNKLYANRELTLDSLFQNSLEFENYISHPNAQIDTSLGIELKTYATSNSEDWNLAVVRYTIKGSRELWIDFGQCAIYSLERLALIKRKAPSSEMIFIHDTLASDLFGWGVNDYFELESLTKDKLIINLYRNAFWMNKDCGQDYCKEIVIIPIKNEKLISVKDW